MSSKIHKTTKEVQLEKANAALRQKLTDLQGAIATDEELLDDLKDYIVTLDPPKFKVVLGVDGQPVTAVLLLSDWHVGEYIDVEMVEGTNTYDLEVAGRRVRLLCSKFCNWIAESLRPINEIRILVLGDMISGNIHKELIATNECPVPAQIVEAANLLSELIANISGLGIPVGVDFITPDNHSRRSKKYQFKEAGQNSDNFLVGVITRLKLSSCVDFRIWHQIYKRIEVGRCAYLCGHGHTVKGWAGFPYYGIDRFVAKESWVRMQEDNGGFDKLCLGHWHVPMHSVKYNIGGSLSGTNELDHACGRFSHPCQVAWLIHPDHGEYAWLEFWV